MAREFNRTARVGSQLQRELSDLVAHELNDPRLGMVTIQEVRVARDLSHAKVYFTLMSNTLDPSAGCRVLNEAAPFLRSELGHRMKIRAVPQLHFQYDESIEQGTRLSALIEQALEVDETKGRQV